MAIHSTANLSSIEAPRGSLQLSEQTLVLALIYPERDLWDRCSTAMNVSGGPIAIPLRNKAAEAMEDLGHKLTWR
jgi:hypothetical protein